MINLLVDEAYAFDYLAILKVKKSDHYDKIFSHLSEQLENIDNIVSSQEFQKMIEANQRVFDGVERARYGTISAKELDAVNLERYYAKQIFQKKFFSTELTEFKT